MGGDSGPDGWPRMEKQVPGGHQQTWDFGMAHGETLERATALADWWMDEAHKEAQETAMKAIEYGSADLKVMGEAMLTLLPNLGTGLSVEQRQQVGQELGIAFYVLGKVARLFGAYEQGRMPSDDTWFDLSIYPKMVRRIRQVGEWS